jgi:hypothetical protein
MTSVQLNEKDYRICSEWNELQPEQMLAVIPHILANNATACLEVISNIPPGILMTIEAWQLTALQEEAKWLWKKPLHEKPEGIFIENLGIDFQTSDGYDLTLLQYAEAESALLEFFQDPSQLAAEKVSRLMLKVDDRILSASVFSEKMHEIHMPPIYHLLALWYFHGIRQHIHETYAYLFTSEDGNATSSPIIDFGTEDPGIDFSWMGIAFGIAETGAYGTVPQVLSTDIHSILYYMMWKKQEAARASRQVTQSPDIPHTRY